MFFFSVQNLPFVFSLTFAKILRHAKYVYYKAKNRMQWKEREENCRFWSLYFIFDFINIIIIIITIIHISNHLHQC